MLTPETAKDILRGWKILVIDDDPASLEIMRLLLRYYGVDIYGATNGKEGLEKARAIRPAFIISDLSMPIMDGWLMLESLRKDPAIAGIPVIALTAHAMTGDREKAMAAGFDTYLTKPLNPITFFTELVKLLRGIPAFAEIFRKRNL